MFMLYIFSVSCRLCARDG